MGNMHNVPAVGLSFAIDVEKHVSRDFRGETRVCRLRWNQKQGQWSLLPKDVRGGLLVFIHDNPKEPKVVNTLEITSIAPTGTGVYANLTHVPASPVADISTRDDRAPCALLRNAEARP